MNEFSNEIEKYGPEWVILLLIARNNNGDIERIANIINNNEIDWGEIIEQSIGHKILPMVCYTFIKNKKLYETLPPWINQYVRWIFDLNAHKISMLKNKALELAKKLTDNNISYAATKGVVLDNQIYENEGYRYMSDIDFMVKFEDREKVIEVLNNLNYHMGRIDWMENKLRELTREEYLKRMFEPKKIPEYAVTTQDPVFKVISVGFVMTFTWKQCEYDIPITEAFDYNIFREIGIDNKKLQCLNNTFHYIYIILHLYKHAWAGYFSSQKKRSDVNLSRFIDVYHFWKKNKEELKTELPIIMKKYNIEEPIIWTLKNTDIIFKSKILKELNYDEFELKYDLNYTKDRKGNLLKLKGNIIDRLYSKNRELLIEK